MSIIATTPAKPSATQFKTPPQATKARVDQIPILDVDVTFTGPQALTCTRTSTLTYTAVLLFCPFCKRPCTPRRISASSLLAISSNPWRNNLLEFEGRWNPV
ncbi:hypothetical protein CROQUDRAFT_96401 [Cronartium quercuum f. sp. fusiforme G11]|uniref:Uncharacterized protein n=1 Tax=Cronartium quercuum f. sp. fusiforme G11 TaxID=708437 RepID=A0A9P6ND27_9BASI|nr:hypothetical protein CROQUDRAFT_96401 [Cronartium quercuum f. sp. fusiforme G11]